MPFTGNARVLVLPSPANRAARSAGACLAVGATGVGRSAGGGGGEGVPLEGVLPEDPRDQVSVSAAGALVSGLRMMWQS